MKTIEYFYSVLNGDKTLNFKHKEWLVIAISDLKSSDILYKNELYPQAVYFLQQSVEKSCKYIGLTFNIIQVNELYRKVGHEPERIFEEVYNSEIMKAIMLNLCAYEQMKEQAQATEVIKYVEDGLRMLNDFKIQNIVKSFMIQMNLSLAVSGVEANSRYPDNRQNTSPDMLYKKGVKLVDNLPFFLDIQSVNLDILKNLRKEMMI